MEVTFYLIQINLKISTCIINQVLTNWAYLAGHASNLVWTVAVASLTARTRYKRVRQLIKALESKKKSKELTIQLHSTHSGFPTIL